MKIGVTGAFGFVGSHLVKRLLEKNHSVKVLAHSKKDISLWSKPVETIDGSVNDQGSLDLFCEDIDILYHLVGIIAETHTKTFSKTVSEGTQNIVTAAKNQNVKKIIYLSALGTAENALSKYHQSKYIAEQAVVTSQIPYLIFRPSVLFGNGDGFISMLEKMIRFSLFLPVIGTGKYKMQPLYIDDLITMMTDVDKIDNEIIEVGGPEKLEYLQILHILKKQMGKKRLNFFIPVMLMKIVSSVLEKIIKPAPITRDQILMMESGSTCDTEKMQKLFLINPISLEDGLQKYMGSLCQK